MGRLTRHSDNYPCRIGENCPAENWMYDLYGHHWSGDEMECDTCPFEKYINRLAELEDEKEYMDDDKK